GLPRSSCEQHHDRSRLDGVPRRLDGYLAAWLAQVLRRFSARVDYPRPMRGRTLLNSERQRLPIRVDHHVDVLISLRDAAQIERVGLEFAVTRRQGAGRGPY